MMVETSSQQDMTNWSRLTTAGDIHDIIKDPLPIANIIRNNLIFAVAENRESRLERWRPDAINRRQDLWRRIVILSQDVPVRDLFNYTGTGPTFNLTLDVESLNDAHHIPPVLREVALQTSYRGNGAIPNLAANMSCRSLGRRMLLQRLNTVLGTQYTLNLKMHGLRQ